MTLRVRVAAAIGAQPHELPGLLAAFACVFAMFSSYSILRPIRETMGLTSGLETLPALFWGTFVAMLALQPVYGWLTARFRRTVFLPWVYLFFVLNILGFHAWFGAQDDHTWIARVYFVWVSVFNLFVVAVFWSLMADVFTREQVAEALAATEALPPMPPLPNAVPDTDLAETPQRTARHRPVVQRDPLSPHYVNEPSDRIDTLSRPRHYGGTPATRLPTAGMAGSGTPAVDASEPLSPAETAGD